MHAGGDARGPGRFSPAVRRHAGEGAGGPRGPGVAGIRGDLPGGSRDGRDVRARRPRFRTVRAFGAAAFAAAAGMCDPPIERLCKDAAKGGGEVSRATAARGSDGHGSAAKLDLVAPERRALLTAQGVAMEQDG